MKLPFIRTRTRACPPLSALTTLWAAGLGTHSSVLDFACQ